MLSGSPGRAAGIAGWIAFVGWLAWRCNAGPSLALGDVRETLTYFNVDASFVLLGLAIALFARSELRNRDGWIAAAILAAVSFGLFFARASNRYYSGISLAFDLANYAQPMWRAAHGFSMDSATYDGRPLWADHGSLAMFFFAPFTRLFDGAAPGLFAVQCGLAASGILAAYGCGIALGLPAFAALATAAAFAAARALSAATSFDFHPECGLGVLLFGLVWARARQRLWAAALLTLTAAMLRDMAALTVGMLWAYWSIRERGRERLASLALAAVCLAIGFVDMFALPRWTGWPSYVAMNASSPIDWELSIQTTVMRALSTFGIGWLHPITWLTGAPWIVAAASSPKLLVKGIDFHYGFMFVPVAALGALCTLAWIGARMPHRLAAATTVWVALAVAVNAPVRLSASRLSASWVRFEEARTQLERLVPREARVAADACSAPYVMEREHLTLLCRLDVQRLQQTGDEQLEHPIDGALDSSYLVVRTTGCLANGPCVEAQLARAQQLGFRIVGRPDPYVVLAR